METPVPILLITKTLISISCYTFCTVYFHLCAMCLSFIVDKYKIRQLCEMYDSLNKCHNATIIMRCCKCRRWYIKGHQQSSEITLYLIKYGVTFRFNVDFNYIIICMFGSGLPT